MPFDLISKIATVLLVIIEFINLTKKTWVQPFFRWLHLGFFIDLIYSSHDFIVPVLIVAIAFKWIKNWYILVGLGALIFIFLKFII